MRKKYMYTVVSNSNNMQQTIEQKKKYTNNVVGSISNTQVKAYVDQRQNNTEQKKTLSYYYMLSCTPS